MAINYDPAKHGGAAFGNKDYDHLKSQGHSDKEINKYIGTLDNSQVSNKYKPQGGHQRTQSQELRAYDSSSKGGKDFGNKDYRYLKNQGHDDAAINGYIRGLDGSQVSNKYKSRGGHDQSPVQLAKAKAAGHLSSTNSEQTNDTVGGGENQWDGTRSNWGMNTAGNGPGYYDLTTQEKAPEGLKPGDMYFNPDNFATKGANGDSYSGITGRVAYITKSGYAYPEFNNSGANKNWDKYAESGSARMSSDGLYQDKYSVGEREGFGGYDYAGGEQHSEDRTSSGIMDNYFKQYHGGTDSFDRAYSSFVGDGQTEGYAGDILKLADQGHFNLTDDQYNRAVVDAQNYNWQDRGMEEGRLSGSSSQFDSYDPNYSYDIRSGGLNQNQANHDYASNNGLHHSLNAMRADNEAKYNSSNATGSVTSNDSSQYDSQFAVDFNDPDKPKYGSWSFDPAKAQQGQ